MGSGGTTPSGLHLGMRVLQARPKCCTTTAAQESHRVLGGCPRQRKQQMQCSGGECAALTAPGGSGPQHPDLHLPLPAGVLSGPSVPSGPIPRGQPATWRQSAVNTSLSGTFSLGLERQVAPPLSPKTRSRGWSGGSEGPHFHPRAQSPPWLGCAPGWPLSHPFLDQVVNSILLTYSFNKYVSI